MNNLKGVTVGIVGYNNLIFYIFTFDLFWFVHYNDVTEENGIRSFTKNFGMWYKCKNIF